MAMFISSRHASFYSMAIIVIVFAIASDGCMAQFNHMVSGGILKTGQNISNSDYTLLMQPDCNLVLYRNPSQAVWYTQTSGKGSECELRLKNNGDLAIHDKDGKLVWNSNTNGTDGNYVLLIQRDRNIVVWGKPIWDSGTGTVINPVSISN